MRARLSLLPIVVAAGAAATWRALDRADAAAVLADPAGPGLRPGDDEGVAAAVTGADGTDLHVRVHGPDGAPTVVLAHAWTCSSALWAPQVRALAGELRVVTYDQRGHGRSAAPASRDFGADALADDLAAVLAATVPAGERALLVGHSMGAMSIVAWAGRHPDQVERYAAAALLVSTGIDSLVDESLVAPIPAGWKRARALAGRLMLTGPLPLGRPSPLSHRALRHIALSRSASPATVRVCEEVVLGCATPSRTGCGTTLTRLDLREAVRHLTVPTTVLVGTDDRLTPPVHAHRLAGLLPRLERLVELPGIGHMSPVEAPGEVLAEIRRLTDVHLPTPALEESLR